MNTSRLSRYLGEGGVESLAHSMRGWYGPPIALAGVPGKVWATKDGFIGYLDGGGEGSLDEKFWDYYQKGRRLIRRSAINSRTQINGGFGSLADLIGFETRGKMLKMPFQKIGTTLAVLAQAQSYWHANNVPIGGAASYGAAPGGTVCTASLQGAFVLKANWSDVAGGDKMYFWDAWATSTTSGGSVNSNLLLYDRLFHVQKTMNSTATEAVTGVPTRYQSTTVGAEDHAGGNFVFVEVSSSLPATAHTWATSQYTSQSGGAGKNFVVTSGIS